MNSRNDFEQEKDKIVKRNGRCVLNALALLKNEVTADELLNCFIASTDEPHNVVRQELQETLNKGVAHGFIVRNGDKYALPSLQNVHEADVEGCDDGEESSDSDDGSSGMDGNNDTVLDDCFLASLRDNFNGLMQQARKFAADRHVLLEQLRSLRRKYDSINDIVYDTEDMCESEPKKPRKN